MERSRKMWNVCWRQRQQDYLIVWMQAVSQRRNQGIIYFMASVKSCLLSKLSPAILTHCCLSVWCSSCCFFSSQYMQGTVLSTYDTLMNEDPCHCGPYVLLDHIISLSVPIIHTKFYVLVLATNGFRYIIFVLQIVIFIRTRDLYFLFTIMLSSVVEVGWQSQQSFSQITSS